MATRRRLSEKQRRILEFIRDFIEEHGYPPSVRDIQRGCNISSTSVVDYNLHILHREGYIRRSPEVSRGIEVLDPAYRPTRIGFRPPEAVTVPVLGTIAAGAPIPTYSDRLEPLDTLDLPASLLRGRGPFYALRVRGLSMVDALIDDGDLVILEPVNQPRNGDMVAVWLVQEGEGTLKRFYHEGDRIRLQPANAQYEPLFVDPRDVEVRGRVVGVVRRYP